MKKIFLNLKNNKKLINWIIFSSLTLIIGTSLILNIIFIPQYIAIKNHNLSQVTAITIDAIEGDPNNTNTPILDQIEYDTNFSSLGDLIKYYTTRFETKSYPGSGDLLTGVKNNDGTFIKPKNHQSWFIYLYDTNLKTYKEPDNGMIGMDFMPLHNNDQYRLALKN